LIAEGSTVVARLTYTGTHQGELFGIPVTGKGVTYSGVAIFLIVDGKIKDGWVLGDAMGLKRQLEAG
jgi:predicted ester cyclase